MREQMKCYDTQACILCFACMVNCSVENRLRIQREDGIGMEKSVQSKMEHLNYLTPRRREVGSYPNAKMVTEFHHCNHCENAPCQEICPTGAITTRAGGEVVINNDICVACQSCGDACPYDVPVYSKETGKAFKCNGCYDRVENGLKQSCVEACPTEAMFSGYSEDVIAEAKKRAALYSKITGKNYIVYGADSVNSYVGRLKWITIVDEEDLADYHKDTDPRKTVMDLREVTKIGGAAFAAAAFAGTTAHFIYWLDKRKKKIAQEKEEGDE
ncbi:MAG: 4Fe-4S dicluster domain-containing protein [Campylobacterota bacterium]|nr:4Fe-4S dicluster domain-containing protein [Campylobacterota bacterium]